jgi:hypothetical protein
MLIDEHSRRMDEDSSYRDGYNMIIHEKWLYEKTSPPEVRFVAERLEKEIINSNNLTTNSFYEGAIKKLSEIAAEMERDQDGHGL